MRLLVLFGLLLALPACDDGSGEAGPALESVSPTAVRPGATLTLRGHGFGSGDRNTDAVALGGTTLSAGAWSDEQVEARVPTDFPGGATFVVVRRGAEVSAPLPVEVLGGNPRPDALPFDAEVASDGGPPPGDAGPGPDGAPSGLQVTFTPDPVGDDQVRLEVVSNTPERLTLAVRAPAARTQAWAAAFHLVWDRNLLRLVEVTPTTGPQTLVREIAPGRLVFGGVLTPDAPIATVVLAPVGRGEGRLELPVRYRTLRDADNRPLAVGWAAGSVRVEGP